MGYLLNKKMIVDNSETKDLLNWEPTPINLTIRDMAESMTNILKIQK